MSLIVSPRRKTKSSNKSSTVRKKFQKHVLAKYSNLGQRVVSLKVAGARLSPKRKKTKGRKGSPTLSRMSSEVSSATAVSPMSPIRMNTIVGSSTKAPKLLRSNSPKKSPSKVQI